jgi:ArsR family transcriptional regulator
MYVDAASLLRLLGDPTRLRLLRALSAESLNVSELTGRCWGSRSPACPVTWACCAKRDSVEEERAGGFSWYRPSDSFANGDGPRAPLVSWLQEEFKRSTAETRADDARLQEVRRLRKENFLSPRALRRRAASTRARPIVAGVGAGARTSAAGSRCRGSRMRRGLPHARSGALGAACDRRRSCARRPRSRREIARRRKLRNITWKRGDIERVPIDDASMDIVLLSQALHHAEHPERAIAEAHRILRPGGRLVVLDLREHEETWVKAKLGDKWLGFSEDKLHDLIHDAGFTRPIVRIGARRTGDPFTVLIAAGTKADS